ncbi:MAG: DUF3185 family protein [Parachlamydia sp.]|nr:DUF3185 family protein [Parachlamydia sp.]
MINSRIAGITLMVVGAIIFVFGLNSSQSIPDQVTEVATGRYTQHTMWYILGGVAMVVSGALLALYDRKS